MTTKTLKVFLTVAALVAVSAPALSQAAVYAYVNQLGEVSTVDASSPNLAISTAPNIHPNSGVILLTNLVNNDLVGDKVEVR